MSEFFKTWRRKIGVGTLLLACLSMGVWLRGLAIQDSFLFGSAYHESHRSVDGDVVTCGRVMDWMTSSARDGFVWTRQECDGNLSWIGGWKSIHSINSDDWFDPFDCGDNPLNPDFKIYHWQFLGIEIGKYYEGTSYREDNKFSFWRISYSSIVLPLALISLALLRSKPTKSIPRKRFEPVPEFVT